MTTFTLSDLSSVGGAPIADSTTSVTDNDPSSTAQFTTLFSFNGSNGVYPNGGLTGDANGDLFGATFEGGANDYGAVFEIQNTGTIAAPVYASASTTLSFDGSNGAPPAGLIADPNGDLFGTSEYYGANDDGTVFEIKNTERTAAPIYASAPTTLVSFNGLTDGVILLPRQFWTPTGTYSAPLKVAQPGTAQRSRSRIPARSPRQSTPIRRPRWSTSTAPTAKTPMPG
jgi:hypothetical protein